MREKLVLLPPFGPVPRKLVGARSGWKDILLLLNCAQISCTVISKQLQRQELPVLRSFYLYFILGGSGLILLPMDTPQG